MLRRLLLTTVFVLLAASSAHALQIQDCIWGFDGRVVRQRINLLSVLIYNESKTPFDGSIVLREMMAGAPTGPVIDEPCYVAPFSAKWLKFYVFVREGGDEWMLSWGQDRSQNFALPVASAGLPADVALQPEGGRAIGRTMLKSFPEEIFPAFSAGADGLRAVVLDHAPRWDGAVRQEAFLDWVRRGGIVHLTQDSTGNYPVFGDALAALNGTAPIGLGRVVRHAAPLRTVSEEYLTSEGFPPATPVDPNSNPNAWRASSWMSQLMYSLNEVAKPKHNWVLIFCCLGAYVLLIGPVNWGLGRKLEYRLVYLYFVVAVAAFAVLMFFVGQRGYTREERIFTITLAEPLGNGRYDLTQWSNLFASRGANYAVSHPDMAGNVYSAPVGGALEANATIRNGRQGGILVEMPINSTRLILHRASAKGEEYPMALSGDGTGGMELEEIAATGALPPNFVDAYVIANKRFVKLTKENENTLKGRHPVEAQPELFIGQNGYYPGSNGGLTAEETERVLQEAARHVMGDAAGISGPAMLVNDPVTADVRHLFIVCTGSGQFNMRATGLGRERNVVIYHYRFSGRANGPSSVAAQPGMEN